MQIISNPQETIEELVWSDRFDKAGPIGKTITVVLRFLYGMLRDIFSTQLTFRAMSLVYTTLLSIVPLIAISFAMAKGLGMVDNLRELLLESLDQIGPKGGEIAGQILGMVENINGKAIGAIGVVFFLWTAISMIQKVEASFNYVWYVSKPRGLARRFSEYLVVLLLGPVIMATAFSMIATLSSNSVITYLEQLPGFAQLFLLIGKSLPYAMIIAMFTFLYMFMPNTRVNFFSALIGGIAGGIMWATVSVVFTTFVATSFRTFAVYASFGIGIIALMWLYLNWLVLLLGSQLAFYHQNPAYLRIGRREPRLSNGMRERLALNVMALVGQAFRTSGKNVMLKDIGASLTIPTLALSPIAIALEDDGLLVTTEHEFMVPGRDMAKIRLQDILDVVRVQGETGSISDPTWGPVVDDLGGALDNAVNGVVAGQTLADLIDNLDRA